MKRPWFTLSLAMLLIAGTTAAAAAQLIEILPQIGVSGVTYTGDEVDSDTGVGFVAGGKLRVGGRVYLEGGVFWSTVGADVTSPPEGGTTDNVRIQDVRIPLALGLKVIKSRVIALRIFGGGYPAFVTSVSDNDFGVVKEDLKSTVWAGRVGAGLDFVLISADVGYDFGVSDLLEPGGLDDTVKRNAFFIEAGLRFGF